MNSNHTQSHSERPSSKPTHVNSLSSKRYRLIEFMQQINFGRLHSLHVQCGEPVFDPPPTMVREHKFASENGSRPELGRTDYLLKQQMVELFDQLDQMQSGVIDTLEIKHGLPFRMFVTETVRS